MGAAFWTHPLKGRARLPDPYLPPHPTAFHRNLNIHKGGALWHKETHPGFAAREPRRYIGTDMLKIIGLLLTVQGTVGVALLQNGLLNMGGQTRLELWDLIQTDKNAAQVLAWSVLSKGMVSLAWPIFAYLAVEGLQNTSSFPRYALRLLITALVSEVPYDLAMSGKWVDWSSQNFLFSLLIGLVALYMVQEVAEAGKTAGPSRCCSPWGRCFGPSCSRPSWASWWYWL